MFMPHKAGKELDELDSRAREEEEGAKFEKKFLSDFPHFTTHPGDVRALSAFRREFKLARYDDLDIFVVMRRDDRDISAERAFHTDDTKNEVVFFTKSGGRKRALEARGHDVKKVNLERRTESERADVVIMLDPKTSVTKRLLENVAPGGWVLCRLKAANSLRARGKYTFKGVIEKKGGNASMSRHEEAGFWKNVEVDSEESFGKASNSEGEDVVTYQEAKEKVRVARMPETDVFKSYSKLIKMAEEQNPEAAARGETLLSCVVMIDGAEVKITINTALPAKNGEHDDDIIVMRKNLAG